VTPERWQKVRKALDDAVGLTPIQRSDLLRRLRHEDADAAAEVESLLGQVETPALLATWQVPLPAVDPMVATAPSHPGQTDGLPVFAMKLIKGQTLADLLWTAREATTGAQGQHSSAERAGTEKGTTNQERNPKSPGETPTAVATVTGLTSSSPEDRPGTGHQ